MNMIMKTFTCRDLGGLCDKKFSGEFLIEILEKAMPHMMSDEAHKAHILDMEKRTGENRAQWMERMQQGFDARRED